jgi:CRISPR/Cas system Type II protein with McrA/HNH and RuvC-like nuclease domain
MAPAPRPLGRFNFNKVWERDHGICQYCGFPGESIDHIIPWSYRHDNSMDNLVVACMPCNQCAHNKMFDTFMEKRDFVLAKRRPMIEQVYLEHQLALEEEEENRARMEILAAEDLISRHENDPS